MRTRFGAAVRLLVLVGLEVAAIPLLWGSGRGAPGSIDWAHVGRWLGTADPEDAVVAVLRLVGMALAVWLLATTVLYLLARASRLPGAVRGVQWATLPVVRRAVDAAVAASVLGGAVAGTHPAGAQVPAPPPIVVELTTTTTSGPSHLYVPVPAGDAAAQVSTTSPRATSGGVTASTAHRESPLPPTTMPTTTAPAQAEDMPARSVVTTTEDEAVARPYHVVWGDNLWSIAEAQLSRQTGRGSDHLAEVEIRNYWIKLMAANEGRLRSGNPNLIYPGEAILCPPVAG